MAARAEEDTFERCDIREITPPAEVYVLTRRHEVIGRIKIDPAQVRYED